MTNTCDGVAGVGDGAIEGGDVAEPEGGEVGCTCAPGRVQAESRQIDSIRAETLEALTWLDVTIPNREIAWRAAASSSQRSGACHSKLTARWPSCSGCVA